MKYCRFLFEGHTRYGAVEDHAGETWIVDLIAAPEEDLGYKLVHARATSLIPRIENFDFEPIPLSAAQLLPPVLPTKILCVGRNYRDHAVELERNQSYCGLLNSEPGRRSLLVAST